MKIKGLELRANTPAQAYVGMRFWIDDEARRIGGLLGLGEEKWVFELLDGDDNIVDKVIKIYRDEGGDIARRDAFMSRLLKDGPIQVPDLDICPVPGGYVGIQTRIGLVPGGNSTAARKDAVLREAMSKRSLGGEFDHEVALKSAQDIPDKGLEAALLYDRASSLVKSGQPGEAMVVLERSLELFAQLGDTHGIVATCNAIGEAHRAAGRCNEARLWYERSRSTAEQCGATSSLGFVYHNLGVLCQSEALRALESGENETALAKFNEADQFLSKTLEIWRKAGDSVKLAQALGQMGRLSLFRNEFDKAEEYATQALQIREVIGLPDVFIDYNTLGMVARASGDNATAVEWFMKRDAAESRVHRTSAPGSGSMISVGAIAEACVESGFRNTAVSRDLESSLAELEIAGPGMDTVARFLRRIAEGDVPEHVPDYKPPIFRDYLNQILERVKAAGGRSAK